IDAQFVTRQTGQSLNIKRRSGDRIRANQGNIVCPEHEDITVVRLHKVVAALINKDLIACVDRTSGNNLAPVNKPAGKDVKVLTQRVGRSVYEKTLPLAYQSRKGEKESYFLGDNLENLVVLLCNHVDVIATLKNKFDDLSHHIWRRVSARMTDNSI